MNTVEQYLAKQNKIIAEDREKTLIALGVTEKEYSPDGSKTWKHTECDYVNGEKRYYRLVAAKVTDEEYALILSKAQQVEEIQAKEKAARPLKKIHTSYISPVKMCPVEEGKEDDGKSRIALILRAVAWLIGLCMGIVGIVIASEAGALWPFLLVAGLGAMELLMFYSLAAILDYLAELAFIVRNGFKHTDTQE